MQGADKPSKKAGLTPMADTYHEEQANRISEVISTKYLALFQAFNRRMQELAQNARG